MTGVFLDTCVLIDALRDRTDEQRRTVEALDRLLANDRPLLVSPVTLAELWAGVRPGEEPTLQRLLEALSVTGIGEEVARRAGSYLRRFHASHGVELGDALIAAGAVAESAPLWTGSRRHFPAEELAFFEPG